MTASPLPPELSRASLVVSTIGSAVPDLRAAMKMYRDVLGWGPWDVYRQEPPALSEMTYHGKPAEFSFLVAGTRAPGTFAFWLCQPLEGPSVYRDLVDAGLPGPHFVTIWRSTEDESRAMRSWLGGLGARELMSARLDGAIEFTFIDAREQCGMIVETGSGNSANQPRVATYP